MRISPHTQRISGLTLVEVLVIIAVLAFLFCMLLPAGHGDKAPAGRIMCVHNLKEIGLAEQVWAGDHGDKFSFQLPQTNGGTMEFTAAANAWRHFQILSKGFDAPQDGRNPEWLSRLLEAPKVFICPTDPDRLRKPATNFTRLSNSNVSYFIGLDSLPTDPQTIFSGDRNITNGMRIKNGILELTAKNPAGWTSEMHKRAGNVALADGSVQQVSMTGLRSTIENTGVFTNHFQMPILDP
jgi:prepilin-type processing-associated H-X9-DG protein